MSEFTDYMQVLTQAETLAAFEVALVASVGSAVVPLHELPFEATETRAAAEEAWAKLARPHWVMVGIEAPLEDLAKLGTAPHLLVEEDFRSWAFVLQSGDAQWSYAILAEPDQYREATVMYPVTAVWDGTADIIPVASGLDVSAEALVATMIPDGGQAFSSLIGAHYEQMEDLSLEAYTDGTVTFPFGE